MAIKPIYFPESLTEGVVRSRTTSFIMAVELDGGVVECYCPTTWHIGNLEVAGRPCLLSRNSGAERKTLFTVEAVSLDAPDAASKKWIGINQTAAVRYMEYYLEQGGFPEMVGPASRVRRAKLTGNACLDFIVGGAAIAIKMPLLALDVPEEMRVKTERPFPPTDRFIRRITSLQESTPDCNKAILVTVYLYDRPAFHISEYQEHYDAIRPVIERSRALGLENWQANFIVTKEFVYLDRYMPLSVDE